MFRWTMLVLFVLSCAVATAAYAGEEKAPPPKREPPSAADIIKRLDKNNDGKLSEEEWLASPFARDKDRAKKSFADADNDPKDNFLTEKELKAHFEKRRAERPKDGERKPGDRKPGGRKPGGKPAGGST